MDMIKLGLAILFRFPHTQAASPLNGWEPDSSRKWDKKQGYEMGKNVMGLPI